MAASASRVQKDPDFQQWIVPADNARSFHKVYYALQRYMTLHPECGFPEMQTLLKANHCKSRLLALSSALGQKPEWPPGTSKKYQLYISIGAIPQTVRRFLAPSEDVNLARLAHCGFSSFWLMNHSVLISPNQSLSLHLERFIDNFKADLKVDPVLEEAFLKAQKEQRGSDLWAQMPQEEQKSDLVVCQNAIGIAVVQHLMNYCPFPGTIFEVGSGYHPVLDHLPIGTASRVHLSDINPAVVAHLKSAHTNATVSQYDILGEAVREGETYDCIAMNDVLNTFSYAEIGKAIEQAWKMLKPGGHLISFTLRNPALHYCLDEYREKGFIYVPLFDAKGLWKGIHIAPKEEVLCSIDKMEPEFSGLQKVLQTYVSLSELSLLQLSQYCTEIMGKDTTELQMLADAFQKLRCPNAAKVMFDEYHYQSVQSQLRNAGFEVKECRKESTYYVGPMTSVHRTHSPGYNHFCADGLDSRAGVLAGLYRDSKGEQDVREEANIHVIVAQKPLVSST